MRGDGCPAPVYYICPGLDGCVGSGVNTRPRPCPNCGKDCVPWPGDALEGVETRTKRAREGDAARRASRIYELARTLDELGMYLSGEAVREQATRAGILEAIRALLHERLDAANDAGEDPAKWRAAIDKLGALWCVL